MVNQSITKKLIIFLVIFNMLLLASYIFVYFKVTASENEATEIYSKIGINEQGAKEFAEIKKTVEETSGDQQELESYFVKESDIVTFLNTVESLGSISNTSVHLTSVNKQAKGSNNSLEVSLESSGSFSNVYYFSVLLETLPYKMNFTKVFFEKETNQQNMQTKNTNPSAMHAPDSGSEASAENLSSDGSGPWKVTITFDLLSYLPNG